MLVAGDFLGRHEKRLGGAAHVFLRIPLLPAFQHIRQIVGVDGLALIVQRETIGLYVVEENLISTTAFGKDEDGGGNPCVRLKHTRRQGDNAFELVLFHQQLADGLVGLAGAEQYTVGHDHGAAATVFEHAQHQGQEQQLGLLGLDLAQQGGMDVVIVQAALEGRIGKDEIEGIRGFVREFVGEAVAQGVLIVDLRGIDTVQQQVHGGDAQHGGVEVEALKHAGANVFPVVLQQVAGVDGLAVAVDLFLVAALW